jgi:hypothetical protein
MFWTLLLIHYHADNLNANITTKIAYSTYSKCGQAMTPMLKGCSARIPGRLGAVPGNINANNEAQTKTSVVGNGRR